MKFLNIKIFLLVLLLPIFCHATDVTLTWYKPDDERVVGYKIYYGITDTSFKLVKRVKITDANTLSCSILNLIEGLEYSFAATSFDANGSESDFSETVSYDVDGTSSDHHFRLGNWSSKITQNSGNSSMRTNE